MGFMVPLSAGINDAANPCLLVTCSALIIYAVWLKDQKLRRALVWVFIAAVFVATLILNFTPLAIGLYSPGILKIIKYAYWVLGIAALSMGYFWGRDWLVLRARLPKKSLWSSRWVAKSTPNVLVTGGIGIVVAFICSALATAWPMDFYMGVLANNVILPGQIWVIGGNFIVYVVALLWPLYMTAYIIQSRRVSMSLATIICSAIFLTAGFGVLYIFR